MASSSSWFSFLFFEEEGDVLLIGVEGPTTDRLVDSFQKANKKCHHFPFSKIVLTPQIVEKQFLPPYSFSIFCSSHAVSALSPLLKKDSNLSQFGEIIAQGPTTTTSLSQLFHSHGINEVKIHQVKDPPYSSPQIFDLICNLVSEGEWEKKKIAVFQSDKGVDFLIKQGKQKGAESHSIHCYTTQTITYLPSSLPLCEYIVISSLQQLSLWTSFLSSHPHTKQYPQTKVIVTSQRIREKAENEKLFFLISPSHDPLDILKTIENEREK